MLTRDLGRALTFLPSPTPVRPTCPGGGSLPEQREGPWVAPRLPACGAQPGEAITRPWRGGREREAKRTQPLQDTKVLAVAAGTWADSSSHLQPGSSRHPRDASRPPFSPWELMLYTEWEQAWPFAFWDAQWTGNSWPEAPGPLWGGRSRGEGWLDMLVGQESLRPTQHMLVWGQRGRRAAPRGGLAGAARGAGSVLARWLLPNPIRV